MPMVDALVGASIQIILQKALSLATEGIGVFFGFKEDLQTLKQSVSMIQAVMADAEAKQGQDHVVQQWLKRLERLAYEADNVLDELNYELLCHKVESRNKQLKKKVCLFFSFSSTTVFRWRMSSKIRNVNTKLQKINQEAIGFGLISNMVRSANVAHLPAISRETDSIARKDVYGRATDASNIVETVLLSLFEKVVSVIPITGMGGLGKTTLAQLVHNDQNIQRHFDEKIWICVSEKFEVTRLFKMILESLTKRKVKLEKRDVIVQEVRKELEGKKYFLVLDDVWNERPDIWDDFFRSLVGISTTKGNWILVTTRKLNVASIVATHPIYSLKRLSDDDCWSILKGKIVPTGEVPRELEEIRTKITKICQGLPLAATVLGGLLRIKTKQEWFPMVGFGLSNLFGNENSVMQLLKLSFDNLPNASLKKCFAYCSMFSKGFAISRQALVRLWMAEGFLQASLDTHEVLEDIGNKYFDILVESSLLEEVKKFDPYFDIAIRRAKMHDFVYDLAKSISSFNSADEISEVHYLESEFSEDKAQAILKIKSKSLRTLFLYGSDMSGDMFSNIKYLRVLTLSWMTNQVLPSSVSKLIHLRFLNLSFSGIESLPESLCKLYSLQTLIIDEYPDQRSLKELPKGMGNLINLRHLCYYAADSKFQMPKGMGQLTCLQTLEFFNVSKDWGCTIEEIGSLKNLRGSLEIRNLELVNGKEGAQQAGFLKKPDMDELHFKWSSDRAGHQYNDEHVLEGLQPHPNLQNLWIKSYMGSQFPRWLMNMVVCVDNSTDEPLTRRLEKLVKLRLIDCKLCSEVPSLGQLPSLQVLELNGLDNLKCIGPSFYGIGGCGGSRSNISNDLQSSKLFPALKSLELSNMPNLIDWTEAPITSRRGGGIEVFPVLENLTISKCSQLTTSPCNFPSLKSFKVKEVQQLLPVRRICSRASTLTALHINGVVELKYVRDVLNDGKLETLILEECHNLIDLNGCGTSLKELSVTGCHSLSKFPEDLHHLQGLHTLRIIDCRFLKSIPIPDGRLGPKSVQILGISDCNMLTSSATEMLKSHASVSSLVVSKCPNLVDFPVDLEEMPSLASLVLSRCPKLTTVPKGLDRVHSLTELHVGPFSNSTVEFDLLSALSTSSVRKLVLVGSPHSASVPEQLQCLTSLRALSLEEFGAETLPDWLGNLESLQELQLVDCLKLQHLPSTAALRRLTNLSFLGIFGCPILQEKLTESSITCFQELGNCPMLGTACNPRIPSNSERSKISHIPNIEIDVHNPNTRIDEELI